MTNEATTETQGTDERQETLERLWHVRRGLDAAFFIAFLVLVFGLALHRTGYDAYLDAALGKVIATSGVAGLSTVSGIAAPGAPRIGWLWQLLAYGFVSLGGMSLLTIVTTLLVTAGCGVLLALLRRHMNVVVAGFLMLAAVYASRQYLVPSGQAAGIFLFGALAALLVNTLGGQGRRFWLAVPLMILWVNMDFTWPAGVALCLTFLPAAALWKAPRMGEKLLAAAAAIAATLVNPDLAGAWQVVWRLPLHLGSAEGWISPLAAEAVRGQIWVYLLVVVAVAVAVLARTAPALLLSTASILLIVRGLSAGSFPIAAIAASAAIAAGLMAALDTIVGLVTKDAAIFRRWVRPLVAQADVEPATPEDGSATQCDALVYGIAGIVAAAGLVAVLLLFAFTAAGSTRFPFGAGIDDGARPAKAIGFVKTTGLKGNVLVPPVWTGYLLWTSYPDVRPLYDPKLLAAGPQSAMLAAKAFEARHETPEEPLAQALNAAGMSFAIVPREWSRARAIARFWSPVYWDDDASVLVPRTKGNMAFIEAHDERLTFPPLFGYGLTKDTLPQAIKSLERKTTEDPDSAIAQYELGMSYYLAKDYNKAIMHLIVALGNDPALPSAYQSMADIVAQTKSDEIAQILLNAFARDPNTTQAAAMIARQSGQARLDMLMMFLYKETIAYDRDAAMAYVKLGNLLLSHNDISGLTTLMAARDADNRRPQLDAIQPGLRKQLDERIKSYQEGLARQRQGAAVQSTGAGLESSAPAAAPAVPAAPAGGSTGAIQ